MARGHKGTSRKFKDSVRQGYRGTKNIECIVELMNKQTTDDGLAILHMFMEGKKVATVDNNIECIVKLLQEQTYEDSFEILDKYIQEKKKLLKKWINHDWIWTSWKTKDIKLSLSWAYSFYK